MKRIKWEWLTSIVLFLCPLSGSQETGLGRRLPKTISRVNLVVDGFQKSSAPSLFREGGTLLLPIADWAPLLKLRVGVSERGRLFTIQAQEKNIRWRKGSHAIAVNGRLASLDSKTLPRIVEDRLAIPLSFLEKVLDWKVEWREKEKTLIVSRPAANAEQVTIAMIIAEPKRYEGKTVTLDGKYLGWKPEDGPATRYGPPVTRSDWALSDGTGCLYVAGAAPNLSPYEDWGAPVRVRGTIRLSRRGFPYIEATAAE